MSYYAIGAVRALLESGAAVDSPDGGGMPMAYALTFGFTDIAKLLEAAGAQLDMRFAAGPGRLDLVKGFVNRDGSLKSDAGRLADPYENHDYDERRIPLIELVLRHGVSVTVQDSRFQSTPLGWAAHHHAARIFDVLAPHAGIHNAVRFGLEARLDELLANDPSLAIAQEALGQTPTDIALAVGRADLAERLRAHAA